METLKTFLYFRNNFQDSKSKKNYSIIDLQYNRLLFKKKIPQHITMASLSL